MSILSKEIEGKLINNNLGSYVANLNSVIQYYDDNCNSDFNASIHGHVIISKLRFFITINMNRMKFLSKSYVTELNHLNPLSCNIILRSILETSAALTYFFKNIMRLGGKFNGEVDNHLVKLEELPDKLSFGDKSNPKTPNAINVLTTIKTIDDFNSKYNISKLDLNFGEIYAYLCEIAHPNYEGYSINMLKIDETSIRILDENRNFSEEDYKLKVFIEISRIYRSSVDYTKFITDALDK